MTELKCLRSQKIQCTQVPIDTFCRQTQLTPYKCTSGQDRWLPDLCQQVSNLSVSHIHFHLQFQFKLNSKEIEMLFSKSELNMLLCIVYCVKATASVTSDSDITLKFALWTIRKYSLFCLTAFLSIIIFFKIEFFSNQLELVSSNCLFCCAPFVQSQ